MEKVNITLVKNFMKIRPFSENLKELCTNKRLIRYYQPKFEEVYDSDGNHIKTVKKKMDTQEEPLYKETGNNSAVVYSGLLKRVRNYFESIGTEYEISDKRPELPEVDYTRLKGNSFLFGQKDGLVSVTANYKGIIKLPTANGKTQLIAYLTELYRGVENVLIVSSGSSVLREINDRIKSISKGKGYILDGKTSFNPKVDYITASSQSLHKIDPDWPDLVLYDEVHGAGSPKTSGDLSALTDCRMFGFSATPEGRSDNSELITEALFGPVILNISYKASQKAGVVCPIRVYMVPVMGGFGDASEKKNDTARDRNGIWRNTIRQNIIAELAREIPDSEKVIILTNTAEHVFRIHKLLPEFTIAHTGLTDYRFNQFVKWNLAEKGNESQKNPDVPQIEKDFKEGKIKKVICTGVWKQAVDFPDLGFLFRVDGKRGSISSIQIGGRLSRTNKGQKKLAVLIDFYDRGGNDNDNVFEGRSKDRISHYTKEGWEVVHGRPEFTKILTEMY